MLPNVEHTSARADRLRLRIPASGQQTSRAPRDEALAQFSHELRNYLGAARHALRVLEIGKLEDAERRKTRRLVARQLEQMARLVDDLLDASLVSSGRLRLDASRIDLRDVVAHAVEATTFRMQQRGHELHVATPDTPLWVDGDAARLEQVFVNLLVNAAKYTEPGGRVDVSMQEAGDQVVVRVRDNGIGMNPELLEQAFDLYVQARHTSRQGGLGLGLPLVRHLVERHGGRVEAASDGPGRGSVFSVWLARASEPVTSRS